MQSFAQSQSLYRKFVIVVTRLCDRAALAVGWDLGSRDQYYLRDIDQLLAINTELSVYEHAANHQETEARSVNAPGRVSDGRDSSATEQASRRQHQELSAFSATGGELDPFSWIQTPTSSDGSPATYGSEFVFGNPAL